VQCWNPDAPGLVGLIEVPTSGPGAAQRGEGGSRVVLGKRDGSRRAVAVARSSGASTSTASGRPLSSTWRLSVDLLAALRTGSALGGDRLR